MELPEVGYLKARFLAGLPDRRVFRGFAVIDEPARKCPAVGRVLSFYKDDPLFRFNDDVDGGDRIARRHVLIIRKTGREINTISALC